LRILRDGNDIGFSIPHQGAPLPQLLSVLRFCGAIQSTLGAHRR
jgi:hypothetical protein